MLYASDMNALKAKLDAFQHSRAGLFLKKVMDDRAPNLAALLAWGTLSAILPLILGVLSLAGLVLRDPQTLEKVSNGVLAVVPPEAAKPLGDALTGIREGNAAPAGVLALVLLLVNGSNFFANMSSVFDQAYHVPDRNFIMQRLVAILMLVIVTALLVISTLAAGLGALVGSLPIGLPVGPLMARVIGWSISIVSAIVVFLLIYKVLPNAKQGWRDVIPGALLATVLTFVLSQVFPLYMTLFPPNHAYAVFGVFLVLTFYLYLLGIVFVLSAELNAFLQQPARSVALAEATSAAQQGRATFDQSTGTVHAEAAGRAPQLQGGGVLGMPERAPQTQFAEQGQATNGKPQVTAAQPSGSRPSLAGRILGFVGLLVAVFLLRGKDTTSSSHGGATA
ncbi:MAG: YihY/virulence factor BrkB family protein [Chloroflexota bacterium]